MSQSSSVLHEMLRESNHQTATYEITGVESYFDFEGIPYEQVIDEEQFELISPEGAEN